MMPKKAFKPSASAEIQFARALKKVARVSGHIVESHVDGIKISGQMMRALEDYSKLIGPWALRQSAKMVEQVMRTNRASYTKNSKAVGLALKLGVAEQETGRTAQALMAEQVALIKSIPLEAGKRAQKLALEAIYEGTRAEDIANELMRTTEVTESRAKLIARTETARANASITQSRAAAVGSRAYIWRTTMDGAERESHHKMNGRYIEYASPPTLTDGTKGHAGTFPNCRCWQDVQFDD